MLTASGRMDGANVQVQTAGGDLDVEVEMEAGRVENLYLTGAALIVYSGELAEEFLQPVVIRGYYGLSIGRRNHEKGSFLKNYGFLICMLIGIVAGCIVGAIWPATKDASGEIVVKGATVLEPLGTVFLNLMFCIAVPTVFCSISSAIANMQSAKRAGRHGRHDCDVPGTAAIAAVISM